MIVETVLQGSPEWFQLRCGCATASRLDDVIGKYKGKETYKQGRADYMGEIVAEILTNKTAEHYVSPAMQWGVDIEPLAKEAYQIERDVEIGMAGIEFHDKINRFAASPDGYLGSDGLIEIKCPNTITHIGYIIAGVVPEDYKPQMLGQMSCSGRKWCDFVSFDPRLPRKYQLFIKRFERDDEEISRIEAEVLKFNAEVQDMIAALKKDRG